MSDSPKYNRTFHLPWSPGVTNDDKIASSVSSLLNTDIIITEKMDGSNTSLELEGCFARTHSGPPNHPSFDGLKALHSTVRFLIPKWYQLFGEWLYAKHSIYYDKLPHYFLMFNVREYNDEGKGFWYDWEEVRMWADEINVSTVPVLFEGRVASEAALKELTLSFMEQPSVYGDTREGVVVRDAGFFKDKDFSEKVMKMVRANHVQTSEHWRNQEIVKNSLRPDPTILVEDGEVFEGTFHHWENCFFSFPNTFTYEKKIAQIKNFCASQNWKCEIK